MNRGGILRRMRATGLLLALYAIVFKAMLPPGFMLAAQENGVAIVLCNGASAVFDPVSGAIAPNNDHDPDGADTSQHCPFAFASAPLLQAPADIAPTPPHALVHLAAPIREAIGPRQATGPPLPARGPPIQA